MANCVIAYDPCFSCDEKKCEICELDMHRKRVFQQSEGEWKDCFNGEYANATYTCSICGKGTPLKPDITELGNMEMIQALSPFCPNCGAHMRGGKNE